MNIIDGNILAEEITEELKKEIAEEKEKGNSFGLGVILVEGDPASEIYVGKKKEKAEELGIKFYLERFNEITEEKLIEKINKWNTNPGITGIIVQLPLPKSIDREKVINAIDPTKDVDGLTDENQKKAEAGKKGLYPATPLGIMEIFQRYNINLKNKKVAILGQSKLVGKPLSFMIYKEGSKVSRLTSKSEDIKEVLIEADIIVTAVGKPGLVKGKMVKQDVIVIDVGTTLVKGSVLGDVDYENVAKKASLITPVPGGVGPLTVVLLMKNVLKAGKG